MKHRKFGSFLVICLLASTVIGVSAASASGYYGGPNGTSIKKEWHTGWNVQGDYTEATASNRSGYSKYAKRVYARSGDDGSYSEWVSGNRASITHKDFGPYKTNKYDARFYWDY